MAKILMMTGAIVIVLGLLGFLVLLVKGRTTGKTSPVLQALKAAGIRTTEAEQRLCRQRVWVSNDMLMTPREQHFYRALLKHTGNAGFCARRCGWRISPAWHLISGLAPGPGGSCSGWPHSGTAMWWWWISRPLPLWPLSNWMMPRT